MPYKAPNSPDIDSLTERQRRALAALLEAPTAKEAAKRAGVNERTMKKYRAGPTFRAAYKAAQADILEGAVNQSRQNLTGALTALADIAEDGQAPPAARVSAARATVELALKLDEQVDIAERLTALEAAMIEDEGGAIR